MYRLIFMVSLLLLFTTGYSQDFKTVDQETYRLYSAQNWEKLIRTGKAGLKQGIDYYYLRMRIAIAYYETKNYRASQVHFRKALEFNEDDPVAQEYLYYAHLFAGQSQVAAILAKDFSPALKQKVASTPGKFMDRLALEYLYDHRDTKDLRSDPEPYFSGLTGGYQLVTLHYSNVNARLHHTFSPGIALTHAYTYLNKTNYYFFDDGGTRFGIDGQKVYQHQYFISPAFTTRSGFTISPSFHYLKIRFQAPYIVSGGGGMGPGAGGSSIQYIDRFDNRFVGGLSLAHAVGLFAFRLGGIYSSLNNENQVTGSAGLTFFPLGNLDLYMGAALNVHQRTSDQETTLELIPDIMIGFGMASKVWMEFSGTYGNMKNYTEGNGYIVYNGGDWMRYKVLGTIIIPFSTKGSNVYFGTRFAESESRFIPFNSGEALDRNSLINNSISIFGGLSWKF